MNKETKTILENYSNTITELDISKFNIQGILNLSRFKNLIKLNCSDNKITDITGVGPNVKNIDCSNNLITIFPIIKKMSQKNKPEIKWDQNPIDTFLCEYDDEIKELPESLIKIKFGYKFNHSVDNLPQNLQELIFHDDSQFNKSIDNLPKSLISLKLEYKFNHSVDNLPQKLQELVFTDSSQFDKPIDNLPNNLISLKLGYLFNHSVNNLPKKLQELVFANNSKFNKPIDNLPNSLISLKLGYLFDYSINNLPQNLIELIFCPESNFDQPIDNLPCKLVKLIFGMCFNNSVDNLPDSIKYLEFGDDFNKSIDNLPRGIEILIMGHGFINPLTFLPNNIFHLSTKSNVKLERIPDSLTSLFVGSNIEHLDLSNIKKLKLYETGLISGKKLQQIQLNELIISSVSDYKKIINFLPNSLEKLTIHLYHYYKSEHKICTNLLPPNLKNLNIPKGKYLESDIKKIMKQKYFHLN